MRKGIVAILISLILITGMASCSSEAKTDVSSPDPSPSESSPPASPSPSQSPQPTPASPPSPTPPAAPIGPDITAEELSVLWRRTDGSTATIPLTAAINEAYGGGGSPPVHNTTPDAYRRLIYRDNVDLIIVTHPSEDEFNLAAEQGIDLEVVPIVKDALVFLTNIKNPVESITLEQLQDIYAGAITSWADLGGVQEDIIPYQRTKNSGSQTLLLKLVMNAREPMDPPTAWVAESMGSLVEVVSSYDNAKNAIGYSVFYYVNNMYGNDQFKLLGINGIKPSRENIMRGAYPLEDYYYAVIRKDTPRDHAARKLIAWLLTDDGQKLAASAGYIPLRPVGNIIPDDTFDPIYVGDVNNSSGTGGTALKATVDDVQPKNGVRPPLSDLFFDGFNYIQYINGQIIAQFDHIDAEGIIEGTWGDHYLLRPFTGIPNNYPNYEIHYTGSLVISFLAGNPFFGRGMNFNIALTEDISPYGEGLPAFSVAYEYAGRYLPNVDLLTASISIKDKPAVSARINIHLKAWISSFPDDGDEVGMLDDFIDWYSAHVISEYNTADWAYRLQPAVELWEDYLSVTYSLQLYDGPGNHMPMFRTICFDVRSGFVVDLTDVIPGDVDYYFSNGFTRIDFKNTNSWGWFDQENLPTGYVPAAGSVITDAWIMYGSIGINVTEPDGRELQFNIWGWDE